MGYTFISYSRKQLYFAEAITLTLQRFDIKTWFDIQQLTIGENWRSVLQDGYENCERLILIASEAALKSPYVEEEWRTAFRNGREIVLVVVENIDIPEILQGSAVFDFRIDFNTRVHQLIDYLAGTAPPRHDKIPASNDFPFSLDIPIVIWLAIATQNMPFLLAFLLSVTFFSAENFWLLIASIFGEVIMFTLFTRRFWNHELNYQTLRNIGWFVLILHIIVLNIGLFSSEFLANFFTLIAALSTVISLIFQLSVLNFSGSLLRWFSAGQVTQKFRLRVHKKLLSRKTITLRENTLPEPTPVPYYIHYDPADQPIAERLSNILNKVGHKRVLEYKQAKTQLVIVTNYTSRKVIKWAGEMFPGSVIFLLGSPVNSIEKIGSASDFQWVDIRENDNNILEILAKGLSNLAAWQREYALASSPKKFEAFHVPISIETYRYLGYLETGGFFAACLTFIYFGQFYEAILAIISGVVMFLIIDRFSVRRLPGIFTFIAGPLIPFLYLTLQFNILIFFAGLIPWILRSILMILAFVFGYDWLPIQTKIANDAIGMDADLRIRYWGYIMIIIFFIINALTSFGLDLLLNNVNP